jgi:hypothetical protein
LTADGDELAPGVGVGEGFGVADVPGAGDPDGFGVEEALGAGDADGFGVGVEVVPVGTTETVVFTGVVAIVTRDAIAIFLITAGVTGAGLVFLLLLFVGGGVLFWLQIATHVILLVPTVTTAFIPVVTELQLQPLNE